MDNRTSLKAIQTLSLKIVTTIPTTQSEIFKFPIFGTIVLQLQELFALIKQLNPEFQSRVQSQFSGPFSESAAKALSTLEKSSHHRQALFNLITKELPDFQSHILSIYNSIPVADQVEEWPVTTLS